MANNLISGFFYLLDVRVRRGESAPALSLAKHQGVKTSASLPALVAPQEKLQGGTG
jgi:hypothetical protein